MSAPQRDNRSCPFFAAGIGRKNSAGGCRGFGWLLYPATFDFDIEIAKSI